MPTIRKKSKKRSKNYKTKRGDVAKHGSSINRINIRIVSPAQTSSTPAVHPESYAMAEQNRLHLSAVQQIVLDNHRQPTGTIMPVRVPVRTSLSASPLARRQVVPPVESPFAERSVQSPSPSRIGLHELLRTPDAEPAPINIRERIRQNSVAPLEPLESRTFPTHTPRGTRRLFYHPIRQQPIVEGTDRFNDYWNANEEAGIDPPLVALSPYRSRLATNGR